MGYNIQNKVTIVLIPLDWSVADNKFYLIVEFNKNNNNLYDKDYVGRVPLMTRRHKKRFRYYYNIFN